MAINNVLPLKVPRRDAIANLKCFWSLGHQRPNFDGYIYIHYAAPSYSARINAIYFFPFGLSYQMFYALLVLIVVFNLFYDNIGYL